MKKILTLAFLIKENEICLAMKKRGFGVGNWNGYGGKMEEGERIESAAIREISEESGVVVDEKVLSKVACINFHFKDGKHFETHIFIAHTWEGEPRETEEMRPAWFTFDSIPYDEMWGPDAYWLPRVIGGEKIQGDVWFGEDGKSAEKMEWNELV